MKKGLIFFLLIFFVGCRANHNYLFDKQNPENIIVKVDFIPNEVTLTSNNQSFIIDWSYNDSSLTLPSSSLMKLLAGEYEVEISNTNTSLTFNLKVIGINTNLPTISKEQLFENEGAFLVLFSKKDCYACESILVDVFQYFDKASSVNASSYLIYQIKYEDNNNSSLFGPNENVLGVDSLEDLEIPSFPTLLLIENKTVKEYYHGSSSIIDYLATLIP
ncbi:MAG: hypothetical protein AB7T03_01285 [Bacilli bacterium]